MPAAAPDVGDVDAGRNRSVRPGTNGRMTSTQRGVDRAALSSAISCWNRGYSE